MRAPELPASIRPDRDSLILIQIFLRHVVFRNFMRVHFPFGLVAGIFHALHDLGFVSVTFFQQLIKAYGISTYAARQTLQISRLLAGRRGPGVP